MELMMDKKNKKFLFSVLIVFISGLAFLGCIQEEPTTTTTSSTTTIASTILTTTSTTTSLTTTTIEQLPITENPIILDAQFSPQNEKENLNEEWVLLYSTNCTKIERWSLHNRYKSHIYDFPRNFEICGKVKIHTGKGVDNSTDLYMNLRYPLWKENDLAVLRNNNFRPVSHFEGNESS